MGGECRETRAWERSGHERRVGDESVRELRSPNDPRDRARVTTARSTPSGGQSAQLTLSSAQRGQQEERGLFYMCVSIVRVCIGARFSGPKRRSATCRESFGHITLNTKGWFYLTRLNWRTKHERDKGIPLRDPGDLLPLLRRLSQRLQILMLEFSPLVSFVIG